MNFKTLVLITFLLIIISCTGNNKHFDLKINEFECISNSEQMMGIQSKDNKINGYTYYIEGLGAILILAQDDSSNIQMIGCELSLEDEFQSGINQIVKMAKELGNTTPSINSNLESWINHSLEAKNEKATLKIETIKFQIKKIKEESVSIYILPN